MTLDATREERRLLAAALLLLSAASAGWAAAAAALAPSHMGALAAMCGPTSLHCGWCVASAAGLVVSTASATFALILARAPQRRKAIARP